MYGFALMPLKSDVLTTWIPKGARYPHKTKAADMADFNVYNCLLIYRNEGLHKTM